MRNGIRYGFYSHAAYTLKRKKVLNKYRKDDSLHNKWYSVLWELQHENQPRCVKDGKKILC